MIRAAPKWPPCPEMRLKRRCSPAICRQHYWPPVRWTQRAHPTPVMRSSADRSPPHCRFVSKAARLISITPAIASHWPRWPRPGRATSASARSFRSSSTGSAILPSPAQSAVLCSKDRSAARGASSPSPATDRWHGATAMPIGPQPVAAPSRRCAALCSRRSVRPLITTPIGFTHRGARSSTRSRRSKRTCSSAGPGGGAPMPQ